MAQMEMTGAEMGLMAQNKPDADDLFSLGITYSTGQQAGRPVVPALRINPDSAYVFVDGALNEPVWQRVTAADGFRQREPNEGAPATEATERWQS